jgi:hypothetical protein
LQTNASLGLLMDDVSVVCRAALTSTIGRAAMKS